MGEGRHKPCVQTFATDQFDEDMPKEAKSPFFNWWYFGIVLGAMLAVVVVVYVQDNISWTAGFGILAGVMAASFALFFIGIPKYRLQSLVGSPVTRVAQVFVAVVRKWRVSGGTASGWSVCIDDGTLTKGTRTLVRTNPFRSWQNPQK